MNKINFDEPEYIMKGIYLYDLELNKQHFMTTWNQQTVTKFIKCLLSEVPREPINFTIITFTGSHTVEVHKER